MNGGEQDECNHPLRPGHTQMATGHLGGRWCNLIWCWGERTTANDEELISELSLPSLQARVTTAPRVIDNTISTPAAITATTTTTTTTNQEVLRPFPRDEKARAVARVAMGLRMLLLVREVPLRSARGREGAQGPGEEEPLDMLGVRRGGGGREQPRGKSPGTGANGRDIGGEGEGGEVAE